MKIRLTSIFVANQDEALKFYTEILGFEKKQDIPVGKFKWLTVVSPEEPAGTELLLEPSDNPAAKAYMESLFEQGIAAAAFEVDDIQGEYERLTALGVDFQMKPAEMGSSTYAQFDDTCGNFVQIYQI